MKLEAGFELIDREKAVLDRFNADYLPALKKHGGVIGEKAMQGDRLAEQVIRRYRSFECWLTDWSLKALEFDLKKWMEKERL